MIKRKEKVYYLNVYVIVFESVNNLYLNCYPTYQTWKDVYVGLSKDDIISSIKTHFGTIKSIIEVPGMLYRTEDKTPRKYNEYKF